MSILTGSTPTNLMRVLRQEVWSQGFTGRTFMVYSDEEKYHNPLAVKAQEEPIELIHDIQIIFELYGEMKWTSEYNVAQDEWFKNGSAPPDHTLLHDYVKRRQSHLYKLSMIASADRGDDYTLREEDFGRAQSWLTEVEKEMSKVFSSGYTTQDKQVMDEIISWLKKEGPKPMRAIERQAGNYVETYRLDKLLDHMINTKQIVDTGGNNWVAAD